MRGLLKKMNENQGLAVGDIIQYQSSMGVIVKEDKEKYTISWFGLNGTWEYQKAFHSRSFIKVS